MFNCSKDPALTYLSSFGYNVIKLPKSDFSPLMVLARSNKSLQRVGQLTSVFKPGASPLPTISANNAAASISGQRSSDLKVGIGLSILGGLISALGGSTLGLSASYQKARTIAFELADVVEDRVDFGQLDAFLADADGQPFSPTISRLLEDDEIFVTTAVLRSNKVLVEGKTEGGHGLALDIPIVQQAVGGKLELKLASGSQSKIYYEGDQPLAFGFQAVRVIMENGVFQYAKFAKNKPENAAMSAVIAMVGMGTNGEEESPLYLQVDGLVGEF